MSSVFITLYCGGKWELLKDVWTYRGDVKSKPMVVDLSCTFVDLRNDIARQFEISQAESVLELSYKNPFNPGLQPFQLTTRDDLDTFIRINELPDFKWSIPLCITTFEGHNHNGGELVVVPDLHEELNCLRTSTDNVDNGLSRIDLCTHMSSVLDNDHVDDTWSESIALVRQSQSYVPAGNDYELVVGKTYRTKTELKNALCLHSISECSQYKIVKSKRKAVTAICIDEACKWRVRFSMLGESSLFTTTKFVSTHTCSYQLRRTGNRGASYHVIAEKVKSMYANSKKLPSVNQIVTIMKSLHRIDASYWKCWKAQEEVKDMIRGTFEDNYNLIPSYLYMLEEANEGSYVGLIVDDDNRFKYVFVAFGQSIRGFKSMRKVITVDGTHLSGKYGGVLLVATAQDANQQIYPMAFGIVDSENDASWEFFFQNMERIVPDSDDLVFVSDRHNSIKKGIASSYNKAFHAYCIWHLKGNLRKRTRSNRILQLFIDGAMRCKESECMSILGQINSEKPIVGSLLHEIGLSTWARSLSPAKRYNIMTSNNAECVNALMKEGREYPVLALLDEIRQFMSRWFAERRQRSQSCVEVSTPKIEAIIQKRFNDSASYFVYVLDADRMEFEVKRGDEHVIVCLQTKSCECKEFDVEEIPCIHAVAASKHIGMSPSYLVSMYYSTENWRAAYSEIIYPVQNKSEWNIPACISEMKCDPPIRRKRCGRLPKARIRASWEPKSKRICGCCGFSGHTKKTCLNQPKKAM